MESHQIDIAGVAELRRVLALFHLPLTIFPAASYLIRAEIRRSK
jgi:hypothetical protein